MARERRAAVVGRVLMKKYGWQLGQQITLRATSGDHTELLVRYYGNDGGQALPEPVSLSPRLPDGSAQGAWARR
jgi:hypothetical protein